MIKKTERIWEIDLLRGIALLLMIYFHVVYDLKEIYNYPVVYENGINYYLGKISGILFIFVAGISSYITRSNRDRAVKLIFLALVITLATYLYDVGMTVKFGILHFLGLSILTAASMSRLKVYRLALLGTAVILLAPYLAEIKVSCDVFFIIGLTSDSFISTDYYPLMPWYGVFLYGLAAGKYFYKRRKSIFDYTPNDNVIMKVGRQTLIIYLLHQPVILLILGIYKNIQSVI